MIDILRELYNGKIYPAEQIDIKDDHFRSVLQRYTVSKKEFRKGLSEVQLRQFDDLENLENTCGRAYDTVNFRKGFQLGMQLTMAGLDIDRLEELLKEY